MKKKKVVVAKKKTQERHSVRFSPDPLTVAVIFQLNDKAMTPALVALVLNESFTGCSVLVNHDVPFKKDQKVKIKVGELAAMQAKVIWVKNLEESIFKIGLKFLE
jgi:hypothetical protein